MSTYQKSRKQFLIDHRVLILAFMIPLGILLCVYISRNIFPFGDNMFLRSDMYHQYAPFMKEFQRKIQNGGSFLYSWNIGMGSNFTSLYAYYLASPLNWLVGLFPETLIPEFMNLMIFLKTSLMSGTFCWFLIRKYKRNDYSATAFSCFYALSAYMAAYVYNVMWLDCFVLFPLILAGLEDLIKNKRSRLYVLSLAISIISNYYISIMISFFLILYFFYILSCETGSKGKRMFLQTTGRFVLYSLLAGCMAAFLVFPAFFNLFYTASSPAGFPHEMKAYFNLMELFSQAVINTEVSMFDTKLPNIYCTMAIFILLPLFWISRRIPVREKIGKTILFSLLIFSFMFNIPTYIWHGFHFPNSLPGRHSFIYIFLVLLMGYQSYLTISDYRRKEIILIAVMAVLGVFILQQIGMEKNNTVENTSIGALYIILYAILFLISTKKLKYRKLPLVLFLLVTISEITVNTFTTGYSTTTRSEYTKGNAAINEMLNTVNDGTFFRLEKEKRKTKNDGALNNYHSASAFSSTISGGNTEFYKALGMQGKVNSYTFYGHTPVTQSLLGVRYLISREEKADPLLTKVAFSRGQYLYKFKYALPLGFMINNSIPGHIQPSNNPFLNQNWVLEQLCGVKSVFTLNGETTDQYAEFTIPSDGRCMIYIPTIIEKCSVEIFRDQMPISQQDLKHLESPWILDLGDLEKGDRVLITVGDPDVESITVYSAVMNYDKYDKAMSSLLKYPLTVTSFSDTCISGLINADHSGEMLLTVPYDRGWSLYIDGVKSNYTDYFNSFIMFDLTEGEHRITLTYWPEGLSAGILISLLATAVYVIIETLRVRKERKWKQEKPEQV